MMKRGMSTMSASGALGKLASGSKLSHSAKSILREHGHAAHTYHPIPVVFARAEGVTVWDADGAKYTDFLSAYSAVNQGHCHPKIVSALVEQASKVHLSSRAFYSKAFADFSEFCCDYFGFERVLPMNTGAEAVETAMKVARRWAYDVKGVAKDEALIVVCKNNFHGRTISVVSMSTDPDSYGEFGPHTPGFLTVPYGNAQALSDVLDEVGDRVAGFLVEPIQGEAGVIVPPEGYLKQAQALCKKHNVLLMCDEIQSGAGRDGSLLACSSDGVRPDVVILGKAISGGIYPVSAVLADSAVMDVLHPGQHGSTYGGNPLAAAVCTAALKALRDEGMVENSRVQGKLLRKLLTPLEELEWVHEVRGRGLFCAVELRPNAPVSAFAVCLALAKRGILCKPTHDHIIRLTPPLVITESQIRESARVFIDVVSNMESLTESDQIQDPIEDTSAPEAPHEAHEEEAELCFHCGGSERVYCGARCETKLPFAKKV